MLIDGKMSTLGYKSNVGNFNSNPIRNIKFIRRGQHASQYLNMRKNKKRHVDYMSDDFGYNHNPNNVQINYMNQTINLILYLHSQILFLKANCLEDTKYLSSLSLLERLENLQWNMLQGIK